MNGPSADPAAAHYAANVAHNYGAPPITLVKGQGTLVWDAAGKRYLDFASGIAVNAVGHAHPHWVRRVTEQAGKLVHVSNLYRNEPQGALALALASRCGPGRVIFCNSGAEANEGLLKLARLHGQRKSGAEGACIGVVVAEKAFHGRTFGGMSATPQEKIQKGFRPLLSGFTAVPLNDLAAWDKAIDAQTTAAVLIESIQGEGGVNPATPEFLRGVERLCRERNVLFMIDEIQCGIGRTGKFFAYEHAGVKPDAIAMAKGLGGGFPIGAIWMAPPHDDLFRPARTARPSGAAPSRPPPASPCSRSSSRSSSSPRSPNAPSPGMPRCASSSPSALTSSRKSAAPATWSASSCTSTRSRWSPPSARPASSPRRPAASRSASCLR